jgi:hypothetical protein
VEEIGGQVYDEERGEMTLLEEKALPFPVPRRYVFI